MTKKKDLSTKTPHGLAKGKKKLEKGDATRYINHAMGALALPPIDKKNPQQIKDRIILYLAQCAKDDCKPTVSGACLYIGCSRFEFYDWAKLDSNRNPEKAAIYHSLKALLQAIHEQQMVDGSMHPVTGLFLAKVHFGFREDDENNRPSTMKTDAPIDITALSDKYADDTQNEK